MKGFHEFTLKDTYRGDVDLLVAVPDETPWGPLAPLIGTPWADEIAVVSGEALSHAMHGFPDPLLAEIGSPPKRRARRMNPTSVRCALMGTCPTATNACIPGAGMPGCYEAPLLDVGPKEVAEIVARAWQEGRYVVVVVGDEFSF